VNISAINFERPSIISQGSFLSKIPITIEISEEYKSDSLHWHDYMQIWYVAEGTLYHTINNKLYIQVPGSLVAVPPYTVHNIDTRNSKNTPRFASISFTDDFLTSNGYNFFSYISKYAHFEGHRIPVFKQFTEAIKSVADDTINELHLEFSKKNRMSLKKISALLAKLLSLLTSDFETLDTSRLKYISGRAEDVTRAIRYMSEHCSEKITLDDLCNVTHMSRRFLTKSFREVTGKTAFEILLSIRINHGLASLLYSDLTLSEIAKNVGLTTKNRFANEFTKCFGLSPMEYKRRMRDEFLEDDEKFTERWEWLNHPDE